MIIEGDSKVVMKTIDDNIIDSIVTDTPYAINFMGKDWDKKVPDVEFWKEAIRISKPGAYLLAFGGDRTHHRLMCAIENAGWEIRTCLYWIHGQGFPKSLDVGKAVCKIMGCEEAKQWDGYGTSIKPAAEIIIMARKPLEGTVAHNVLKWGTGVLNIKDCRIQYENNDKPQAGKRTSTFGTQETISGGDGSGGFVADNGGRWPAQVIHDGSDEVIDLFQNNAQRFFYCAKPTQKERNAGCEDMETVTKVFNGKSKSSSSDIKDVEARFTTQCKNDHVTVKPIALMRWLVRLVTPTRGGLVMDIFCGSGTTGIAAKLEGFDFIGIEIDKHNCDIANARINGWKKI